MSSQLSKILEFEREFENSINEISKIELQLDSINEMRSRLFIFEENISSLTFEHFRKKIEILELEMKIIESNMILEDFQSGECYEEIALQQLIKESKKDYEIKESNDYSIRIKINNTLQSSISYRLDLVNKCKSIQSKFDEVRIELQSTRNSNESKLHQILTNYNNDINLNIQKSLSISNNVTEDSLILRHNCRIATDLLTQKRLALVQKRKELQDNLQQLHQNVEETLKNFDNSYMNEIEMKLQPKLKQVIKLEDYLENIRSISSDLRLKYQNDINQYKKTKKFIKYNYEILQLTRKEEILKRQSELQELKNGISAAESKLFHQQNTTTYSNLLNHQQQLNENHFQQSPVIRKSQLKQMKNKKQLNYTVK